MLQTKVIVTKKAVPSSSKKVATRAKQKKTQMTDQR
jgi:hypothetical protein